jgi:hypothetical protein
MLKLFLLFSIATISAAQEYGGPSVLSRGLPSSVLGGGKDITFRPFFGILGVYESGLTGVLTDAVGRLQNGSAFGVELNFGVYGRHNFRHTVVGLTYTGSIQHFPSYSYYDGVNQTLSLNITHQLSRRVAVSLVENAGTYSRNYFFTDAGGLIDPTLLNLPRNGIFDNRVIYGLTLGSLAYRVSPRLSFNINSSGYLMRRRSTALLGVTGYTAGMDGVYRLTRFLTLGMAYNFNHMEYTRAFGSSNIHSGGLLLSARLSRSLEFSIEGGASRVETLYVASVPVDPVVAALTGQTASFRARYSTQYVPTGYARLTRSWQFSNLGLGYSRQITPGDGVYLTSTADSALLSYTYTGLRHWNVGANFGYSRISALAQQIGAYRGYQVGVGVTRDLRYGLHFVARGDVMRYLTGFSGFRRFTTQASVGLSWSPGELPLALW